MLHIEKPELLNVIAGPSALAGSFQSRPSHALVFKLSGESIYRFSNEAIRLNRGEMLFIPMGSSYSYRKASSEESHYVLINFYAAAAPNQPRKYRVEGVLDFEYFCERLCCLSMLDTPQQQYKALALFYQALDAVCEVEKKAYHSGKATALLDPAVEYLQENLYGTDLRVGMLHTLCGISDTYFRKLFIARFGAGPKQYVLDLRLRRAKDILDQGEYNSIAQVAKLAGFEDPLYFSKQFRKAYGCTPSSVKR